MATLGILKELGANFALEDASVVFKAPSDVQNKVLTLDAKESGSTLRFFLPICSALGTKATFIGSFRLMERPIDKLVACLSENGAKIDGFSVNGKLKAGTY